MLALMIPQPLECRVDGYLMNYDSVLAICVVIIVTVLALSVMISLIGSDRGLAIMAWPAHAGYRRTERACEASG